MAQSNYGPLASFIEDVLARASQIQDSEPLASLNDLAILVAKDMSAAVKTPQRTTVKATSNGPATRSTKASPVPGPITVAGTSATDFLLPAATRKAAASTLPEEAMSEVKTTVLACINPPAPRVTRKAAGTAAESGRSTASQFLGSISIEEAVDMLRAGNNNGRCLRLGSRGSKKDIVCGMPTEGGSTLITAYCKDCSSMKSANPLLQKMGAKSAAKAAAKAPVKAPAVKAEQLLEAAEPLARKTVAAKRVAALTKSALEKMAAASEASEHLGLPEEEGLPVLAVQKKKKSAGAAAAAAEESAAEEDDVSAAAPESPRAVEAPPGDVDSPRAEESDVDPAADSPRAVEPPQPFEISHTLMKQGRLELLEQFPSGNLYAARPSAGKTGAVVILKAIEDQKLYVIGGVVDASTFDGILQDMGVDEDRFIDDLDEFKLFEGLVFDRLIDKCGINHYHYKLNEKQPIIEMSVIEEVIEDNE